MTNDDLVYLKQANPFILRTCIVGFLWFNVKTLNENRGKWIKYTSQGSQKHFWRPYWVTRLKRDMLELRTSS